MNSASDAVRQILQAASYAAKRHRDQRRKGADASPYINHPLELATLLADHGAAAPDVLTAALLHDVVEDTCDWKKPGDVDRTYAEIEQKFGRAVRKIVAEVTDDKRLDKAARKERQISHAAHLSAQAKLVKLADKICNVRDVAASPPTDWTLGQRREYFDWARQVVDQIRGSHPALEKQFDQAYAKRP
jgi:GTP diphosphokinase / guanosine-3',5'-bis(diphosphate) 3'-diphosphatase